jgi:transcriptional regulator with XRE-family HTH domain
VRVRCNLRHLREQMPRKPGGHAVSLKDLERRSGVATSVLSQVERGVLLPLDRHLDALEEAYGAPVDSWYDARTLLILQADGDDE